MALVWLTQCAIGVEKRPSNPPMVNDGIARTEHDYPRLPVLCLAFIHFREAHDGEQIARFAQVSRSAVQHHSIGAALPSDEISFEAVAIGQVATQYFFIRHEPDLLH